MVGCYEIITLRKVERKKTYSTRLLQNDPEMKYTYKCADQTNEAMQLFRSGQDLSSHKIE